MDYAAFVSRAKAQDKRNKFMEYKGNLDIVPDEAKDFYRDFSPVDVEIDSDGLGIAFYPVEKLAELQEEYSYISAQFVFATCNGDPIFINNKQVFTCAHGIGDNPEWEKLAESFGEYMQNLID